MDGEQTTAEVCEGSASKHGGPCHGRERFHGKSFVVPGERTPEGLIRGKLDGNDELGSWAQVMRDKKDELQGCCYGTVAGERLAMRCTHRLRQEQS